MNKTIKTAAAFLTAVLFFAPLFAGPRVPQAKAPREILVEFKKTMSASDIRSFEEKHKVTPLSAERAAALLENIYGLEKTGPVYENVPFNRYKADPSKMGEILRALGKESLVLKAQPNYYRYALAPDDPIYTESFPPVTSVDGWAISTPNQWGFRIINADDAYDAGLIPQSPAAEVIVAVVDTGIKTDHPDLAGVTMTGMNILSPFDEPYDDDPSGGHGTHVAGIIAANTGNSQGMAGTAYTNASWTAGVRIMPVKMLDSTGTGTDADGAAGIIWAADNGADVVNFSVGGPEYSEVLQDAVNYAFSKGCVIVAAAGNNNGPAWYPAAFANVISVAASGKTDSRISYSNYGKVDVTAPGIDIWSTVNMGDFSTTLPAYYSGDGTSFAAPHVSGLAALLKLKFPGMAPGEIRRVIERSAQDIGAAGYDQYTGWGRIDALRALNQDYNAETAVSTYNWPNPFSPGLDLFTTIVFQLASPVQVTISIYDAGGDLVHKIELAAAQVIAGTNSVAWDGRNMGQKVCANGTYFYTVKSGGTAGKNKIVIIH